MEIGNSSEAFSEKVICEIPLKMPSINEYINACRRNKYAAAKMKTDIESSIILFVSKLPRFKHPIKIDFLWVEENKRRDIDNVSGSKKFILDAMVKCGVLTNDNRKCFVAFTDNFTYGKEAKVILTIQEVERG